MVGTMNRQQTIPDLQAFFAKELLTGIKLAKVPIEEPPIIDPSKTKSPMKRRKFGFVKFSTIILEVSLLRE